jgi:hypothetical protein
MPRPTRDKASAGSPQPLDTTNQQRQEKLEILADIFACIFGDLTPEQRANYMTNDEEQNDA